MRRKRERKLVLLLLLTAGLFAGMGKTTAAAADAANKKIQNVEILDVREPVAAQAPDTTAICNTQGVKENIASVTWRTAFGDFGENLFDYGTIYSAVVVVEPAPGNEFAADVKARINGNDADVHLRDDGSLEISYVYPITGNGKLFQMQPFDGIEGIASGTSLQEIIAQLPKATIYTTDGVRKQAEVFWDENSAGDVYNPKNLKSQTFIVEGQVLLPAEIEDNGVSLDTEISVTVSEGSKAEAPTANIASGTYDKNLSVELGTATQGAEIRYTLDGSEPGAQSSLYNGPITVNGKNGQDTIVTIKAVTLKSGMYNSDTATFTYTIKSREERPEGAKYTVLEGADQIVDSDRKECTIRVDAEISKFVSVFVDGQIVDSKNYKLSSGSTIITFTKEYMQTLSAGTHTVQANFTDGYAEAKFTVKEKAGVGKTENTGNTSGNKNVAGGKVTVEKMQKSASKAPVTGDTMSVVRTMALLIISAGILLWAVKHKREKSL